MISMYGMPNGVWVVYLTDRELPFEERMKNAEEFSEWVEKNLKTFKWHSGKKRVLSIRDKKEATFLKLVWS